MGFLNDVVNGKEKKIKKDPLAGDINAAGKTGLEYLTQGGKNLYNVYSEDPTQIVNTQIGMENRVARTAADDAMRRTKNLMAQRGMGTSSINLGQQVNQERTMNNQIAMNNAGGLARLRDMKIDNAQGMITAGNALFAPKQGQGPIQMSDTKYRSGGYGQLIAAGGRAMAGGA